MLTKVSEPTELATPQIIKFFDKYGKSKQIERIQDNLSGYLLIKFSNNQVIQYNYNLNKFYSHNLIQVSFLENKILKQLDSFDQNNWILANKLRSHVIKRINWINKFDYKIESILGIGGEYYLYWICLNWIKYLTGISNHESIVTDAKTNIPWSRNYLVDYNDKSTYPEIITIVKAKANAKPYDLVLINLFQIHSNVIDYVSKIPCKKIILIACNLPDSKIKLIIKYFRIKKIKYFKNFDGLMRVLELEKKLVI